MKDAPKDRWTLITDDAECAALMLGGKWREDRPTTVRRADGLWALVNDVFKAWRENRTGNSL
jgi:hypothetical protein